MTTITPDRLDALATASAADTTASTSGASTATARRKRAYLHHLDLIRMTTFSLVIFVHCLTMTTDEFGSVPVNSTSLLFHFTRNTFFALTGFVLMYQNFDKSNFDTISFWRKRIGLVIFPYLVWSAIYWVVQGMWSNGRLMEVPMSLDEFFHLVIWGLSGFQMYFLFVMVQVYLLFPLVLWLLRATAGRHATVLAVSLIVQLGITLTITYWHPPAPVAEYWWHHYATFIPYQFSILYGAIAAVHRDAIGKWLRGKGLLLVGALLVTGAIAVGSYLLGLRFGGQPVHDNNSAFFPTLLPFLIVAIACLYAIALRWGESWRDHTPRFARIVSYASNRSFSVFLVHVLVLFFLLRPQEGDRPWLIATLGQPWGTIVTYVATLAGSLLIVEVLRRLPGSKYLTGRDRLPVRLPARAATA